jgi:hypothetical protein
VGTQRSYWFDGDRIRQRTIAVDEASGAYFWQFPLTREDASFRYVLGMDGQLVIVKQLPDGQYGFIKTSEGSRGFIERAKLLIRQALSIGGIFLQDDRPPSEAASVPDAQFVNTDGSAL